MQKQSLFKFLARAVWDTDNEYRFNIIFPRNNMVTSLFGLINNSDTRLFYIENTHNKYFIPFEEVKIFDLEHVTDASVENKLYRLAFTVQKETSK